MQFPPPPPHPSETTQHPNVSGSIVRLPTRAHLHSSSKYFQQPGCLSFQILFDGKKAVGVEFIDTMGRRYKVFATKEIILSASAINTPQILMLSGVGPKSELDKHQVGW